MRASGGHFHDRHGRPYSAFATRILNKIADRLNGIEEDSPGCPRKEAAAGDGLPPPYGLVRRLDAVSARLAAYLRATDNEDEDLFTSKLVPKHWWGKDLTEWPAAAPLEGGRKTKAAGAEDAPAAKKPKPDPPGGPATPT